MNSWGRTSKSEHLVLPLTSGANIAAAIASAAPGVAFGMGRSYGDACLNPGGNLWDTRGLDHFISFDRSTGRIACESGVLLRDIQRLVVPCGWMLPVTPGTQLITLGGAIANDVHGKNHHVFGTFGNHILEINILRTDGHVVKCSPSTNADWFSATVGGIGLTGLILSAEIQLRPVLGPWLNTESIPYESLDEFFTLADSSESDWEYTVSWIDCVSGGGGRGIFMRANHSPELSGPLPAKKLKSVPIEPPLSLINGLSLRAFNAAYFNIGKLKAGKKVMHYEPFFYPLDNVQEWNRIYGPKGFYQYQCVVPRSNGNDAISAMLQAIANSGTGSFLAVLKTFGNKDPIGMLSFPQPGVTLALDFPNLGDKTKELFERLDSILLEAGGRIYLAKDAQMPRKLFENGYPHFSEFLKYRDPGISSGMSRRLLGW